MTSRFRKKKLHKERLWRVTRINVLRSGIRGGLGRIGLAVLFLAPFIGVLPAAAQAHYGDPYGYGHQRHGFQYGFNLDRGFHRHHDVDSGYSYGYYRGPSGYRTASATLLAQTAAGLGGLDLNLRPRKAQVFVDGQRLSKARNFDSLADDGWLEKGPHRLSLYQNGYLTVVQEFTLHPGALQPLDVDSDVRTRRLLALTFR